MAFKKKTIKDIELAGKRIVYRPDWNVPGDDRGNVTDDFRIRAVKETFDYMLDQGVKQIVVLSHRGRPKGQEENLSLRLVAQKASEILDHEVTFNSQALADFAAELPKDKVVLLENVRFYEGEKANSPEFIDRLASFGDVFVLDGFAVAHRASASVTGIATQLPAVAGFLIENEVTEISQAIDNPAKPVLAITGGSKLETKLPLLENFMNFADQIVVAGVMANTMLVAKGYNVGSSIFDEDEVETAKEIIAKLESSQVELVLPMQSVAVGKSVEDSNRREVSLDEIEPDDLILDFGQADINLVINKVNEAKTIIWNGPLGFYENKVFAKGSEDLAQAIANSDSVSVVGGGDTGDVVNSLGLSDKFTHVSTGGGASLELMSGKKLPGIEALLSK